MPVRNTAHFLHECIDSILSQSYKKWELIAIDDHSTDNGYNVLLSYAEKYDNIKVYKNTSNGIIPALRLAFHHSSGKYITRMDSDDVMTNNKLSLLRQSLSKRNQLSVGKVRYISDNELGEGYKKYAAWLNGLTESNNNFSEIYKECVIPSPCWMMHKEDLLVCGAFDSGVYPEDYDLCFRMRNMGMEIIGVNEVIHLWRDHSDRASRNDPNYKDNNFLDIKLHYFMNHDRDTKKKLILWGAGKKGKYLAQNLLNREQDFHWISDNEKKVDHKIYDKLLESSRIISSTGNNQIIIAIAQRGAQDDIRNRLSEVNNTDTFYFC